MERKIVYTNHLLSRIEFRAIPKKLPEEIYSQADAYYFDLATTLFIAVKSISRGKTKKKFAVAFSIHDDIVYLITVHPLKKGQEENRVNSGRWQKTKEKI
ncbi:MAG: hypothetical protein HY093_04045 [Candidatus Liptonbacteria bacterium]|nr:hypothetical protein [Candidatus Liptonbacteria bacterium]